MPQFPQGIQGSQKLSNVESFCWASGDRLDTSCVLLAVSGWISLSEDTFRTLESHRFSKCPDGGLTSLGASHCECLVSGLSSAILKSRKFTVSLYFTSCKCAGITSWRFERKLWLKLGVLKVGPPQQISEQKVRKKGVEIRNPRGKEGVLEGWGGKIPRIWRKRLKNRRDEMGNEG